MSKTFFSARLYIFVLLFLGLTMSGGCKKENEESKENKEDKEPETKNPDKLLAYYSFDVNSNDFSGNENNGQLKNDAVIEHDGRFLGALKLDGEGDYVTINGKLNLSNDFSLSCWIKPSALDRSDAAIFAKYQTNRYGPYDFYLAFDRPAFWISDGKGSHVDIESNGRVKANAWTHIAWTASNHILKIFINGVLDTEAVIPEMTQNNDEVTIGRQALLFTDNGSLEFKGSIDELRLYERQLTPEEVASLYNRKPVIVTVKPEFNRNLQQL
jgi:arabinan endo-1,5-alpha-L-arabinosidase